ncbi:AIR synthase related protein [Propionimicrobium sp. PCR01-08-3]|uniref:AIR synthase related protein n=1 Tax=Propionimicrobium sp. PCR01-08-3 TaxID=3052086 RepID=UPI00255C6F75|nr:AIR synthase related protein [Propionimicrobium sp. PCR01-08-3]WIY84210.1 AIR synthase related protein [Propionimicrobium sp. PCR01-08-3]
MQRFRDLLVFEPTSRLVIACDSIGGIGPKPGDSVHADEQTVAHFGVRVPLLEVLCSGARPIALINALCVERNPTGQKMIDEIEILAAQAGIPADAVSGSTEENAPTTSTGIGVTVIGSLDHELPKAQPGDVVICAGLPIASPEFNVYVGHPDQVTVAEVRDVLASGLVHDALPVGSHGIGYELAEMARVADLESRWLGGWDIDPKRSAGPASCVLFACPPNNMDAVVELLDPNRPASPIARLSEKDV